MADQNLQNKTLTDNPVGGEIYIVKGGADYRITAEEFTDPRLIGQQVISANTTLATNIRYVIVTQKDTTITLFASPLASTTLKVMNDSGGNIVINGNGKLIYDTSSIILYNGEGLHVFFNNDKWNIV